MVVQIKIQAVFSMIYSWFGSITSPLKPANRLLDHTLLLAHHIYNPARFTLIINVGTDVARFTFFSIWIYHNPPKHSNNTLTTHNNGSNKLTTHEAFKYNGDCLLVTKQIIVVYIFYILWTFLRFPYGFWLTQLYLNNLTKLG